MKPEQIVIETLFEKYQKQGYVTEEDIFTLCEEYDLSFIKTDYVGNQLLAKGVFISDGVINTSEEDDVQDIYDYAQTDYQEIYDYFLTHFPEMKNLIEYVKTIPPVQKGEIKQLFIQIRSGNKFAREVMINKHIRSVLKFVLYYKDKTTISLEDIFSEAMTALIKAVDSYNPYENSYFLSYVATAIKHRIDRYMCYFEREIRLPANMIGKINTAKEIKFTYLNLESDELIALIAKKLEISIVQAEELYAYAGSQNYVSWEELIENEDEFSTYISVELEDSVEKKIDQSALKKSIEQALNTLTDREKQVISLRYGLIDDQIMTLEEVGIKFHVTRERVRQIEAKALRKLKHPSRSKYFKIFRDL